MTNVLSMSEVYGLHQLWYTVRNRILKHDFTDPNKKFWLVQWQLDSGGDEDETWEPVEVFKDVEAFHHYCTENG